MAVLLEAQITTNIKDFAGDVTTQQEYFTVLDTNTLADVITDLQSFQDKLDLVTDGQIIDQKVHFNVPLDVGLKSAPVSPGAPIAAGANFNWQLLGSDIRSWGNTVPAFAQHLISAGKVNLANVDVTNWVALFATGGFPTINALLTNLWGGLSAPRHVILNTRKHRREQNKVNFETE